MTTGPLTSSGVHSITMILPRRAPQRVAEAMRVIAPETAPYFYLRALQLVKGDTIVTLHSRQQAIPIEELQRLHRATKRWCKEARTLSFDDGALEPELRKLVEASV